MFGESVIICGQGWKNAPTLGEGVVGGASWLGACDDDGNLLYSRGMMEAEMKKGKLAMFCGYALCFVLFFVLINETALVVNNVKYIIMLIILGYGIVALLKLPEEKKKLGYWLVFCIVMGSVGYIDIIYLCYLKFDKWLFWIICIIVSGGMLISIFWLVYKIKKINTIKIDRNYIEKYKESQRQKQKKIEVSVGTAAFVGAGIVKLVTFTESMMYFLGLLLVVFLIWAIPYIMYSHILEYYINKCSDISKG